ncbi:MAG: DUF177 domain-containing protein [Pyrinomonadaceae bacterium]
MLLQVDNLADSWTPIAFSAELNDGMLDEGFALSGPVELRAEVRRKDARVQLRGDFNAQGTNECSRCLANTPIVVAAPFDVFYTAVSTSDDAEDLELSEESLGVAEFSGDTLDLKEFAREQVVLNLPARVLCREECAGLCETCGANKNLSPCGCVSETIDPRWQALKGLVDG